MVPPDLGEERRARDPEEQRSLALVAAGESQHRGDVASLGGIEGLRGRHGRAFGHDKIGGRVNPWRQRATIVMDHEMTGSTERLAQGDDVLTIRVADDQADMQGIHGANASVKSRRGPPRRGRRARPAGGIDSARHPEERGHGQPPGVVVEQLLDISKLAAGDEVQHPLLVLEVVARGGEHPRTTLLLGNRTGRIETAPFWAGRDEMIRGLSKGTLAQVVGKATMYREALQLEVTSIRPLPKGSLPLSDLVPSVGPVDRYWQFIDEARAKLTAPRLRAVLDLCYTDEVFRERYQQCPGAPGTGHHAALGGLLQHTCEVVAIARQMARIAKADDELVVAGALLHDIGKTQCYAWETGVFDTNERGRLVGHVVQGLIMLREAIQRASAPPCTADEQLLIEHLILSHHGQLEFGSPVRPLTLEAEILHFADDASAKTASIKEAYDSADLFPGDTRVSSRRVWQLDNRWLVKLPADFGRGENDAR